MASEGLRFRLSYSGLDADESKIDFYDIGQALIGFQRSLALTTHLVLNGEIITQAPSLKGAKIFATTPEEGSWTLIAIMTLVGGAIWKAGTAPRDTPLGHLISSAYDYAVSEILGFHVDYSKTLGQQIDDSNAALEAQSLPQSKFDSHIEKIQVPIRDMHRPIVWSRTALEGKVTSSIAGQEKQIGPALDSETYEYIAFTSRSESAFELIGRVSSYNVNTFKGRIYVTTEFRPIPFELATEAQTSKNVGVITRSLQLNASDRRRGNFKFSAFKFTSKTGRLKSLLLTDVIEPEAW